MRFGDWDAFLKSIGQARGNRCFIARNFLLDEGLTPERTTSYDESAKISRITTFEAWVDGHETYLRDRVFRPQPADFQSSSLDPRDLSTCPETFRCEENLSTFGQADGMLDLVRVVRAKVIAQYAERRVGEMLRLFEDALSSTPAAERLGPQITSVLDAWTAQLDLRPVYAAFWEDAKDLLTDGPADWADQLRDRLGVYELAPNGRNGEIPIVVFRYPVRHVPKFRGSRPTLRLLAVPTVFDGQFCEAFCPAPKGLQVGFTVDLSGILDTPIREVVHPFIRLGAQHVCAIGYIRKQVPRDLSEARLAHLMMIRELSGRNDYAMDTDGDLA